MMLSKTQFDSKKHENLKKLCGHAVSRESQQAIQIASAQKNNCNATFTPPEWAHKELGDHVFITAPNAPTKCHKTKLA